MSHLHPLTHPRAEIYSPALSVSAAGVGLGSRERSEPQNCRAIGVGGDLWDHRVPPNPHRDPSAPRSPPGAPLSAVPHTGAAPWRWTSHMGWFPYTSGHGLFSWCFVLPDCSPVLPQSFPVLPSAPPLLSYCSPSAPQCFSVLLQCSPLHSHCSPSASPVLPHCSPIALPVLPGAFSQASHPTGPHCGTPCPAVPTPCCWRTRGSTHDPDSSACHELGAVWLPARVNNAWCCSARSPAVCLSADAEGRPSFLNG